MLHLFVRRDSHLKVVVNPFSCFPMPYHSYLVQTILTHNNVIQTDQWTTIGL